MRAFILFIALLLPGAAAAQTAVKFPTSVLPGLTAPATISATLRKPEGNGPFPAVIVLHDCGGIDTHVDKWSRMLVDWGYVAIVPDSFGSRGHKSLCRDVETVGTRLRVQDAIGTAEYLATLPYVRKDRIGVVGFSHGGWTIMKGVQENAYWSSYGIKAAVGIYPYCTPGSDNNVAVPLLILIGEKDDWTPVSRCQGVIDGARNRSLITMKVYPGAYHSFDRDRPTAWIQGQGEGGKITTRKLEYDRAATRDSEAQARAFFDRLLR